MLRKSWFSIFVCLFILKAGHNDTHFYSQQQGGGGRKITGTFLPVSLAHQMKLRPVIDPPSKPRWTAPKQQHLKWSSGLHM